MLAHTPDTHQGCGMTMFADKRKGHHERACGQRFVACPLGCPKPVRETEKLAHVERDCIRRPASK